MRSAPTLLALLALSLPAAAVVPAAPLLVAIEPTDDGLLLVGLHALDGTRRWQTQTPTEVDAWGAGDLDGDGQADVVTRALAHHGGDWTADCHLILCAAYGSASWTWIVEARSGADGSRIWSREIEGGAHDASVTASPLEWAGASALPSIVLEVEVIPDATGDARRDVIVQRVDLAGVGASLGPASSGTWLGQTHAWVLDGATGTPALALVSAPHAQRATLLAAGDLDADGAHDLVWTQPVPEGLVASAFGAGSLAPLWTARLAAPDGETVVLSALRSDVTGDARADLVRHTLGLGPFDRTLGLVSGADGATLWDGAPGASLVLALDLGGSHALVRVGGTPTEGAYEAQAARLSPLDGTPLATRRVVVPTGDGFGFVALDAIGVRGLAANARDELLVSIVDARFAGEWSVASALHAFDGASLAPIDARSFDGLAYVAPMGGDVLVTVARDEGSSAHRWSPAERALRWSAPTEGPATWRGALDGGALLGIDAPGAQVVRSLDADTGAAGWSAQPLRPLVLV